MKQPALRKELELIIHIEVNIDHRQTDIQILSALWSVLVMPSQNYTEDKA